MNDQLIKDLRQELSDKNLELRKLEIEQTKLLNATKRVKVPLRNFQVYPIFKVSNMYSNVFTCCRTWKANEKRIWKTNHTWSRKVKDYFNFLS